MINIIITTHHLTPNETLNDPQHSNFLELMYLLEALIQHASPPQKGRAVVNHQHKASPRGPYSLLTTWVFLQLLYFPQRFLFSLLSRKLPACADSLFQVISKAAVAARTWGPSSASLAPSRCLPHAGSPRDQTGSLCKRVRVTRPRGHVKTEALGPAHRARLPSPSALPAFSERFIHSLVLKSTPELVLFLINPGKGKCRKNENKTKLKKQTEWGNERRPLKPLRALAPSCLGPPQCPVWPTCRL